MIRVLLVADANLLRTALALALSVQPDMDLVAEANTLEVKSAPTGASHLDVTVVDLDGLGTANMHALDTLTEQPGYGAVLALTAVAASVPLRRALNRRVRAFLSRDCHINHLLDAVRRVAAGERFIEPDIAAAVLRVPDNPLTARERDVLKLAAEGMTVREIAGVLFLTAGTVRTYLSTIMHKVGARSRLDAIRVATDANWL